MDGEQKGLALSRTLLPYHDVREFFFGQGPTNPPSDDVTNH